MILRSILVLVQIASISCGILELIGSKSGVVTGVVGRSLSIRWRIVFQNNESTADSSFQVCPDTTYKSCFASGIGVGFNALPNTRFGDRTETENVGEMYTLTINNLNKTDDKVKLYVRAVFRESAVVVTDIISEEFTIKVKAYPKLIRRLPSALYLNEDDKPTVSITASGIPKPTVQWNFGGDELSGTVTDHNNHEYTYEVQMSSLKKESCGKQLRYSIIGYNNSVITNTSTVYVNFTLKEPNVEITQRTEIAVSLSWELMKIGECSVNYTIDVLDMHDNPLQVIKSSPASGSIVITFSSEVEGRNATTAIVTASYQGQRRLSKTNITFSPTPTSTPTKNGGGTGSSSSSSSSTPLIAGVVAGVIVVIIIIGVIVFYLKKKNEKKSHSSIGSAQGADNSYNHIPLDSRDGAQENSYSTGPSKPPSRENDPDQMLYAELGAGGGRTGPKPAPEQSNYAVVKVDDMGYPARGPTSDKKPQPTYAAVNRDRSRRHSPPPPDDDNEDGPKDDGGDDNGSNTGAIVGGVLGAIAFIIIVVVVVFLVLRWKKNDPSKTSNSERMSALRKTESHDEGTVYASTETAVPQQQQRKQQEYAALGAGGGRTGPREEPNKTLYAQVKTDEHGYPATGPAPGPAPDDEDGFNSGIVV